MISRTLLFGLCVGFLACCALEAQDGSFSGWFERSDQAKADQPSWMTPRLEQEFRSDFRVEQPPI
jgi:hypothetical protein